MSTVEGKDESTRLALRINDLRTAMNRAWKIYTSRLGADHETLEAVMEIIQKAHSADSEAIRE